MQGKITLTVSYLPRLLKGKTCVALVHCSMRLLYSTSFIGLAFAGPVADKALERVNVVSRNG